MVGHGHERRVCIVVASRANYGRIKSVIREVDRNPGLELMLVVGASALLYRFGKVVDIIERDQFPVAATFYCIVEGDRPVTMAKSTGLAIQELSSIFESQRPDVVISVADRFETIATAIAASYMNIPLAHTQGGEVTGSIDESVRHAVTKLAHIHFPATELAGERLVRMGEDPKKVFVVGCPSIDVAASVDMAPPLDLFERYGGVGSVVDLREPYLVVLQHPVTTEYGQGLNQINETLKAVYSSGLQTIWLWPNVDAGSDDISKGLRVFREVCPKNRIHFFRNFATEDYYKLIYHCGCLVGNSSSALREGAFLGVPAVNIGTRQTGRERAENVIDVPNDARDICKGILRQMEHGRYPCSLRFGDGRAGERIAEVLRHVDLGINKTLRY